MDIIGKKYNMLTCLKKDESKDKRYYIFKCDCGKEKSIIFQNVLCGYSKSCGCLLLKGNNTKHGGKGTRLYNIWKSMRERCNNPNNINHKTYYDNGIKVCAEWDDFSVFKKWALSNGYSEKLTIDRIDSKGNYNPLNCRWATYIEQANNTKSTRFITFNGKTLSYSQWERELGLSRGLISSRISKGWNIEKVLSIKNYALETRFKSN